MGNNQNNEIKGAEGMKVQNDGIRRFEMSSDELIKLCEKFYKQVDRNSKMPQVGSAIQLNQNKKQQKKAKQIDPYVSFYQVAEQNKLKFKANSPYRQKEIQQNTREANKDTAGLQYRDEFIKYQQKSTNSSTILNNKKIESNILQSNQRDIGMNEIAKQIRMSKEEFAHKYKTEKEKQKAVGYKICYEQFIRFMSDINNYAYKQDFVKQVDLICNSHIEEVKKNLFEQSNQKWKQYIQFLALNLNINRQSVLIQDNNQGIQLFKKLMQAFMYFIERVNKRALQQIQNACKKSVKQMQCQLNQQNKLLAQYQKIIVNLTMDLQLQHSVMIAHLNYQQKLCGIPKLQKAWSEPLQIHSQIEVKNKMDGQIVETWKQNKMQQKNQQQKRKLTLTDKKFKTRKPLFTSSSEQDNKNNQV